MNFRKAAGLFALSLTIYPVSAFAQTADGLTPYGQIRAYAGFVNQSKEISNTSTTTGKDNTDYVSKLTTTRLGVKGKYGEVEGVLEIGLKNYGDNTGSNSLVTRRAYGILNINDSFNVKIGQDEAPYTFYGNAASFDNLFNGFGDTAQQRDFQIKFTYAGAYLDLLNPKDPASITSGTKTIAAKNWDIPAPKVSAGYDYKSENGSILAGLGGVLQTQTVNTEGSAALDSVSGKRLNAWLAYAHTLVKIGSFSLLANAGYGENTAVLGITYSGAGISAPTSGGTPSYISGSPELNPSGKGFSKTNVTEALAEVGYDFGAALLRAGIGYAQAKNANWKKTDSQIAYYGQVVIPVVSKRLNIVPEVSYFDFQKDKNGVKQGTELAAGAFIQFLF